MIVLMGVAGSGKSSQGKMLADDYGYAWISTGEVFRVLITGKRRQEMLSGKLLSDKEVIKVVDTVFNLIDTSQEFVIDGFPRTIPQADWLIGNTKSGQLKLSAIIHLEADESVVLERLVQRGRQDDNSKAIAERFREYRESTLPILEHFVSEGVPVHRINADQTTEEVHKDIMKVLNSKR
ncbi:MAG: nucleoside monophosphate kinase [Candidatus Saccharimonadales bacterium]